MWHFLKFPLSSLIDITTRKYEMEMRLDTAFVWLLCELNAL